MLDTAGLQSGINLGSISQINTGFLYILSKYSNTYTFKIE